MRRERTAAVRRKTVIRLRRSAVDLKAADQARAADSRSRPNAAGGDVSDSMTASLRLRRRPFASFGIRPGLKAGVRLNRARSHSSE